MLYDRHQPRSQKKSSKDTQYLPPTKVGLAGGCKCICNHQHETYLSSTCSGGKILDFIHLHRQPELFWPRIHADDGANIHQDTNQQERPQQCAQTSVGVPTYAASQCMTYALYQVERKSTLTKIQFPYTRSEVSNRKMLPILCEAGSTLIKHSDLVGSLRKCSSLGSVRQTIRGAKKNQENSDGLVNPRIFYHLHSLHRT